MARRVYFAFHFERDIFRVNVVRNSNVVLGVEEAGFRDQSEYDEVMRKTPEAIARNLRERMKGTSVTVVLIGRETWQRPWVNWEIQESIANKNGLLGVYIHHVSSLGRVESILPLPTIPTVPATLPFPIMFWDSSDLREFAREVEAAGQRADQQRTGDLFRQVMGARLLRNKNWWEP